MKIEFSSITLHVRVALKSQYKIVVAAKPFPANQNVKYVCYYCAQILHTFAGNVYEDSKEISPFPLV